MASSLNFVVMQELIIAIQHNSTVPQRGVGMAHEKTSPKNQPRFYIMTMSQYWLDKIKPSEQPETLSTSCY